jgi:periplasmic copper chaperone A
MKTAIALLLTAFLAAACERAPEEPRVTVADAVVTLPAAPGRPGAAYFTLTTNHDPTRLLAISSPNARRIELHETMGMGGMSRMAPLADAGFWPDHPLTFAPGGRHAMLFDLDPRLRPGSRIRLTFRFDPAPPVTVEAEVRAPGDSGHAGH